MRKPITIHNDAFLLLLLVYKGASIDPGKLREWLGSGWEVPGWGRPLIPSQWFISSIVPDSKASPGATPGCYALHPASCRC